LDSQPPAHHTENILANCSFKQLASRAYGFRTEKTTHTPLVAARKSLALSSHLTTSDLAPPEESNDRKTEDCSRGNHDVWSLQVHRNFTEPGIEGDKGAHWINEETMNLKNIVDSLEKGNLSPEEVKDAIGYCSAILARSYFTAGSLAAEASQWIVAKGDQYKSLAATERAWEATEQGQKEIKLKHRIKGVEAIREALTTNWFFFNRDAKNQM
jgi:hypothetical protein